MLSESYKNRLAELAGINPTNLNDNFKNWFKSSKVTDESGIPILVYHGTGSRFKKFNVKKSTMGIIWFTSDKSTVEAGEVGAKGKGHIMDLYVSIQNPAGWNEYDKFGLGELKRDGFDGAILPGENGKFNGFVFNPNQLKSIKNDGSWDMNDNNIYS